MLERARALGVYDRLVEADLTQHLRTTEHRHDLVLAADVFIYVGDLERVFEGVCRVTDPGALFCFSVEATGDEIERGFELLPSLRYRHSARYLQALAARHGFEVAHLLPQTLREDQRKSVPGLYAYLVRR
jgi:predicted TPR repeat methyltransferase